jgi:hypothetical protein
MNAPKPQPPREIAQVGKPVDGDRWARLQALTDAAVSLERLAGALTRLRRAEGSDDRAFSVIYAQEVAEYVRRSQRDVVRLASGSFRDRLVELSIDQALDGLADSMTGTASQIPSSGRQTDKGPGAGAAVAPPSLGINSGEADHSLRGSASTSPDPASRYCVGHPAGTALPCRACAIARQRYEEATA